MMRVSRMDDPNGRYTNSTAEDFGCRFWTAKPVGSDVGTADGRAENMSTDNDLQPPMAD